MEVNASIKLAIKDRESGQATPNCRNLCNFIVHGLKFVFRAKPGGVTRGIPTAFAAAPLNNLLISGGALIWVWPHANGKDKGQLVEPLFRSAPEAAHKDDRLYEYLALIDAIWLGNQREIGLASERLSDRLLKK